jgi:hypothetical protein
MSIFRLLPREANYIIVPLIFLSAFGYSVVEGNKSSTTVRFRPDSTKEAARRAQLPDYFLPVHEAGSMIELEEEDRQKTFSPETRTTTALFDMPVVASTVHDFYVAELPKKGWKIKSDKTADDTETIEVSKDNIDGLVVIHHADAGCGLDLQTVKPK